jgi:hypothetical protein
MDPVTAVVVAAVISAGGAVLAAWIQARAQRPVERGDRPTAHPDEPVSGQGPGRRESSEFQSDDRR